MNQALYTKLLVKKLCIFAGLCFWQSTVVATEARFVFSCRAENDLYQVLVAEGLQYPRFDTPTNAVQAAQEESGVLILADDDPQKTTLVDAAVFKEAAKKRLKLYVEYPAFLPKMNLGAPKQSKLERGVVFSDFFGEYLSPMQIIAINDCHYVPAPVENPHLVLAKVAGVDKAAFGLKDMPYEPLLFEYSPGDLLVATTKLSYFVTGRYMPDGAWRVIWQKILAWFQPGCDLPNLEWTPTVLPSFGRDEPLPADAELQALRRLADWIIKSRTPHHPQWPKHALDWALTYNTVHKRPTVDWPIGDGSLGITEGYSSTIYHDGSHLMRYAVRADCNCEVAMLLAFDAAVNHRPQHGKIAENLVEYIFFRSGLVGGRRADLHHPAHGLMGWALDGPGVYYGDDNARVMLSALTVSALQKESRWDDPLARCLLANLRMTGAQSFRKRRLTDTDLQENGWQYYWHEKTGDFSPHYEGWLWACFLWSYDKTRFQPLLVRSREGLRMLMASYPDNWSRCLGSRSIEVARVVLPLAWLVRVDDIPEHHRPLRKIVNDLAALQDSSGGIRESLGLVDGTPRPQMPITVPMRRLLSRPRATRSAICSTPVTFPESACMRRLLPPASRCMLKWSKKLAEFLCRTQIHSTKHPELDGAWYRAFDFRNWDYWASNGDCEWGAWFAETGWSQPWIAATFALQRMRTSLWELTKDSKINDCFERVRREMLPDEVLKH